MRRARAASSVAYRHRSPVRVAVRRPRAVPTRKLRSNSPSAAFQARYPGAQVRNFGGGTGAANGTVTEMDALVAYLQVLGTMVDFRSYKAEDPENLR